MGTTGGLSIGNYGEEAKERCQAIRDSSQGGFPENELLVPGQTNTG